MALSRANNGKCAGWQVCGELIHVALALELGNDTSGALGFFCRRVPAAFFLFVSGIGIYVIHTEKNNMDHKDEILRCILITNLLE
jgi:uncharacterized membrane protein